MFALYCVEDRKVPWVVTPFWANISLAVLKAGAHLNRVLACGPEDRRGRLSFPVWILDTLRNPKTLPPDAQKAGGGGPFFFFFFQGGAPPKREPLRKPPSSRSFGTSAEAGWRCQL